MRKHLFVDEAGNFDFSSHVGASKYFILTSIVMEDCDPADRLLELRRRLVWEGHPLTDAFHATSDKQAVRDRVFEAIVEMDVQIHCSIFEKRKTPPELHDRLMFYRTAWFYHANMVIPPSVNSSDELMVVAASLGTRKEQIAIGKAINEMVRKSHRNRDMTRMAYWPAATDPCLQIADYCCWAIQRLWERDDARSFQLIEHLVAHHVELWGSNSRTYY